MSGFLVDTNVISEFVKPEPSSRVIRWFQVADPDSIFASVMTLGEIRMGIESLPLGKRRSDLERWLREGLPVWFLSNLLFVSDLIADRRAKITIDAKRRGVMLEFGDGLIAATALEHNLALVTRNVKHFEGLEIGIVNPWET